jgi:hypothetical protein
MQKLFLLLALSCGVALFSSCSTPKEGEISSIPWNRPQKWEGAGALGGFRPPGSQDY